MPTHKQVRCTIYTEDGPLPEYEDPSLPTSPTTKTAYVQVRHASKFWIKCETLPGYKYEIGNRVSFRIAVDGEGAQSCWVSEAVPKTLHGGIYSSDEAGGNYLQPFEFTTVLLVEDQDVDERAGIGEISIFVLRSEKIRPSKDVLVSEPVVQAPCVGRVTEESAKGKDLTHVVKLGCKEPFTGGEVGESMEFIDTKTYPYTHFRIFYRSKEALQNLGLIPRTQLASLPRSLEGADRGEFGPPEKRYRFKRRISDVIKEEDEDEDGEDDDDEDEDERRHPRSKWMRPLRWGITWKGKDKANPIDLTLDDSD